MSEIATPASGVRAVVRSGWLSAESCRDRCERFVSSGYLVIALTVAISVMWAIAAGPSQFVVTYWPDDAFFYKIVARNIVQGLGSTADGIGVTNGYHPLWMGVHVALEWMFSNSLLPQLLLQGVLLILALFLLFDYVAVLTNRAIALGLCLIAACEQTFLRVLSSGMETILAFIGLLSVLRLVQHRPWQRMELRDRVALSAAFALVFFARLDGGILWVGFSLLLLAGCLGDTESIARRVKFLFSVFLVPASLAIAYLAINQLWFGSMLPVSGRIKSAPLSQLADPNHLRHGLDRLVGLYGIDTLSSIQSALGAAPELFRQVTYLAVIPLVLVGIVRLLRRRPTDISVRLLSLYAALHTAYYVMLQHDAFSMQWARGPEVLLMSSAFCALLFELVERAFSAQRLRSLAMPALVSLMVVAVAYNGVKARQLDVVRDYAVSTAGFWDAVEFVRGYIPADAVIASPSIGFVGYFSGRPVFSVDGLLNSTEYYTEYLRRNRTLDYMISHGVRYSINAIPVGEDPIDYLCRYYPGLERRHVRLLMLFDRADDRMWVRRYGIFELSF